ncbi:Asp23/Gls24 family envelope stress response protein [Nonomuraea soli]|uniref:Putative alkaline shock family protein YloU n=1 Tax=Nonomuraea soli TaxID=1032476 RepID=A0A7W0CJ49_9ACTN|nr:Asp23/Gls24 family envelope stress response protein [Nonomuraea soli]MBA2892068.1 putative alkaline shock family protein YloU [Nonomuraea soli]
MTTLAVAPAQVRGRTDVSDRVVSKLARQVAGEVAGVSVVSQAGGLPWGGSSGGSVEGELATIRLTVAITYPAPIRATTERLRQHVADRITELTGLGVSRIDLKVASLTVTSPESGPPKAGPGAIS